MGPFKRTFTLHQNIRPELIKAKFKEGILEIELPNPAQEHLRQIKVDVE